MGYYIGIDIGGMSAKCAMLRDGELYGISRCNTNKDMTSEYVADMLADLVKETVNKCGMCIEAVNAVGIGCPGIIDSESGTVVCWTTYGWGNEPLKQLMQARIAKSVYIINDANAAALGEYEYGAGKEYKSMVMITIGTSIGSAIIRNGTIFDGEHGAGGEIGHEVIKMNGEKCACGRRGCFESYASATALIKQTKQAMIRHPESALWNICGGDIDKVNGKTVFDGQRAGDRTANTVLKRYYKYLSTGITNAVNVFYPEAVILGGGVSSAGEILTDAVGKIVNNERLATDKFKPINVLAAKLGNNAGIYGAAEYARRKEIC